MMGGLAARGGVALTWSHCARSRCDVPPQANPQEMLPARVRLQTPFRGPQQEIVEHVIAGGSALVLMPTGRRKRLCYQVPALCLPWLAV